MDPCNCGLTASAVVARSKLRCTTCNVCRDKPVVRRTCRSCCRLCVARRVSAFRLSPLIDATSSSATAAQISAAFETIQAALDNQIVIDYHMGSWTAVVAMQTAVHSWKEQQQGAGIGGMAVVTGHVVRRVGGFQPVGPGTTGHGRHWATSGKHRRPSPAPRPASSARPTREGRRPGDGLAAGVDWRIRGGWPPKGRRTIWLCRTSKTASISRARPCNIVLQADAVQADWGSHHPLGAHAPKWPLPFLSSSPSFGLLWRASKTMVACRT